MKPVQLALSMPPEWESMEPTRRAVAASLEHGGCTPGLRDALVMTCSELMENAVKYGLTPAPVEVLLVVLDGRCMLSVTNQVPVPSPHGEQLQQRVAWLSSRADPAEAYRLALEETSRAGTASGNLGLVRIVHEGGCQLVADLSRVGWVTVTASRPA